MLARELDFISVHTYPEWEKKDIDEAMPYTIANLQAVRNALPDARMVITEAGWATVAREFGTRASEEKHWGLFTVDRKAKLAMQPLYPDLKNRPVQTGEVR